MMTSDDSAIGNLEENEDNYYYTNRINFFDYARIHATRYNEATREWENAVESLHGLRGANVWAILTSGVTFLRRYLEFRKEKAALIAFVTTKAPEVRSAYSSELVQFTK